MNKRQRHILRHGLADHERAHAEDVRVIDLAAVFRSVYALHHGGVDALVLVGAEDS